MVSLALDAILLSSAPVLDALLPVLDTDLMPAIPESVEVTDDVLDNRDRKYLWCSPLLNSALSGVTWTVGDGISARGALFLTLKLNRSLLTRNWYSVKSGSGSAILCWCCLPSEVNNVTEMTTCKIGSSEHGPHQGPVLCQVWWNVSAHRGKTDQSQHVPP